MFKLIDDFLNNITMYRLVLYFLIVLAGVGLIYSVFGVLPFDPISYVLTFSFILLVGYIANSVFAYVFEAPTNVESVWITALILGLIITPPKTLAGIIFIGFAATLAMAGKFIFAIGKKHLFNPVALSVFLTATFINGTASWWVGTSSMLPVVAIGGFLVVRKIRRWDLVLSYLIASLATTFLWTLISGGNVFNSTFRSITDTALIFFASIMITEPLTTPPTRMLRIIYGTLVGFLFSPQVHFGTLYFTPEIALIIGNIYSYIVSPKYKLILTLKQKIHIAPDIFDFVFTADQPVRFTPGQYMEFTFQHPSPDDRGNRRYLSLANSPTETDIRLGIKVGNPPSSYKRSLLAELDHKKIVASQLIGDFKMPEDPHIKLLFIAGGIGITPYRSMIKYLTDTNQKRDIVLLYTASRSNEFVYADVIDEAKNKWGLKVIYNASQTQGRVDANFIARQIPDYKERIFYISGSHGIVEGMEKITDELGIPQSQIIKDYFPGFA